MTKVQMNGGTKMKMATSSNLVNHGEFFVQNYRSAAS